MVIGDEGQTRVALAQVGAAVVGLAVGAAEKEGGVPALGSGAEGRGGGGRRGRVIAQ